MIGLVLALGACAPEPDWRVWALEYGRTADFRARTLLATAPAGARRPLSWMVFVAAGHGRVVLVDTGFVDPERAARFRVEEAAPPEVILAGLGLAPTDMTDVVITHGHWDHVGHLGPWSRASVWMQGEELRWMRGLVSPAIPERDGVRLEDVAALDGIGARLRLVDGVHELAPGFTLHEGGSHTPHTQWVEVQLGGSRGALVLGGDEAYLYENAQTATPSGSTYDAERSVRTLEQMSALAGVTQVVPGHDPAVFDRCPQVAPRVVALGPGCDGW